MELSKSQETLVRGCDWLRINRAEPEKENGGMISVFAQDFSGFKKFLMLASRWRFNCNENAVLGMIRDIDLELFARQ